VPTGAHNLGNLKIENVSFCKIYLNIFIYYVSLFNKNFAFILSLIHLTDWHAFNEPPLDKFAIHGNKFTLTTCSILRSYFMDKVSRRS
jgi:hypothetical protein